MNGSNLSKDRADDSGMVDIFSTLDDLGVETAEDLLTLRLRAMKFEVYFIPKLWNNFDNFLGIKPENWTKIKYFQNDGNKNDELLNIPNDKGGIYIYYIQPSMLPLDNYFCIMYVGRAHYGKGTQNLRKRINSYETEAKQKYSGRVSIRNLFNRYRDYLYVMYVTVDGNNNIDRLEEELVKAIVPPANQDLFQKELKDEKKMF